MSDEDYIYLIITSFPRYSSEYMVSIMYLMFASINIYCLSTNDY